MKLKPFLICTALAISGICQAEVPKLLTERAFTSASLAEAANHFIAIGEPATFKEIEAFLVEDATHTNYRLNRGYDVNERVAWVFRIIYVPKETIPTHVAKTGDWIPGTIIPLRAPNFGTLDMPEKSLPAEKWPLYPLTLSGSTYIVLKERYTPKGVPETINHYMEYCRDNGAFRKTLVTVPTRDQALNDAEQLRQSTSWKAIQWVNNGGVGFPHGAEWTWEFIQKQTRVIPQAPVAKAHPKATSTEISAR